MSNLWERLHKPMPSAMPEPAKKRRERPARDIAAEVRETLKYERRDEDVAGSRLGVTPNGPHVQTPASDSRAPGATHLPVAGGHHLVRFTPRTGVRRMQVPSEPRDVQTATRRPTRTTR